MRKIEQEMIINFEDMTHMTVKADRWKEMIATEKKV